MLAIGDKVRVKNQPGEIGMNGIIRSIDLPSAGAYTIYYVEITYIPEDLNSLYANFLRRNNNTDEFPMGYNAHHLVKIS